MASDRGVRGESPAAVKRSRRGRRAWRAAFVLLAVPVAALLFLSLVEVRIPISFLRERLERLERDATGLEIRHNGPIYLVTGLRPGAEVHDLVITASNRGQPIELLRVGLSRAEVSLEALLVKEVRLESAKASDVAMRFDATAFAALENAIGAAGGSTPSSGGWRFVEAEKVEIERARGMIVLPALTRPLALEVDAMTLSGAEDAPLTIEARGTLADETMRIEFRSASLGALRTGKRRIPMKAHMTLANAQFTGEGVLDLETGRGDYQLSLSGHGRFLERVLPGFQAALGEVQNVSADGRLRTAPNETALESITIAAGRTRLQGELRQREANGRFRLDGRLGFETLDLRPWLPLLDRPAKGESRKEDAIARVRSIQRVADIALDLTIGELIWPQGVARGLDASLGLSADAVALSGAARLPVGALQAKLRLDTAQSEARLEVDASGRQVVLEALHPKVAEVGVSGMVREAKLALHGAGTEADAIVKSLEGELDLKSVDARWRHEKDGPVTRVKIDTARLAATRETLHGAFTAALDDATIVLKLESERAAVESDERVLESAFDLSMRRARHRGMRLAARGHVKLEPRTWSLDVHDARLGNSRGRAKATGAWEGGAPLSLSAALTRFDAKTLEFFEFESVRRRAKPSPWEETKVLPAKLRLPGADFELSVARFEADRIALEDLRVAGRSRDGRLERTHFALKAKGGELKGELSADLHSEVPQLQARIAGTDFDLLPLAGRLDVKLERASAKQIDATLELRGARLKEVVAQSTMQLSAQGLELAMPGLRDARRRLAFDGKLEASSRKGALDVSADGRLNGKPFRVTSRGPQLATLLAREDRVPLDIDVALADNVLALHGTVAKGPAADLKLQLTAKRVDELLALGGVQTQAQGALAARTRLRLTPPATYVFENLDVKLGESTLSGRIAANWSAARPALEAKLAGPKLRLADLGIQARELENAARRPADGSTEASDARHWSESLRRMDAALELQVDAFYAAGDLLGSLQAVAGLKDGRLHVGPLVMREGDSVLRAEGEVDATVAEPQYAVKAELRKYDLTPLLKSFEPRTKGSASFDARAVVRSHGVGEAVVSNLSGALDVASYAVGVGSGAIELMGINLLGTVLNTLDRERTSKINCAVGVFDVDKGLMKSRVLFVDTTRLRIMGNLDIDLVKGGLDGGLRPYPKNPRLFNVPTPVSISGTLEKPDVSVSSAALPELLIRYSTPYTMFLGTLMETENAKADGSDDCRAAYARVESARPELDQEMKKLFRFLP